MTTRIEKISRAKKNCARANEEWGASYTVVEYGNDVNNLIIEVFRSSYLVQYQISRHYLVWNIIEVCDARI